MSDSSPHRSRLQTLVDHLAHYLPAQGPIGVFVHHNTLHAFQQLPFEQAVLAAQQQFGAEPYLRDEEYRLAFRNGRIRGEDLRAVLEQEGTDSALRYALLTGSAGPFHPETIRWHLTHGTLRHLPAALVKLLRDQIADPAPPPTVARRPCESVLALTGIDLDDVIHPILIRLCSAFVDQGAAYWPMPNRGDGLWRASLEVLGQRASVHSERLGNLPVWVARCRALSAEQAVEQLLAELGVAEADQAALLRAELQSMPGWPGLLRQLEQDPSLAPHESVPASLMDFLAVRLLLSASATEYALGSPRGWRVSTAAAVDIEGMRLAEAARVADAALLTGGTFETLMQWPASKVQSLVCAVQAFTDTERRRVWHAAFERRHERQVLLPLRQHAAPRFEEVSRRLRAQVFFCIDEREESFRRHLEEVEPEVETYGAAGFFGVAMDYTGIDDASGAPLCPVVVKPQHAVRERPATGFETSHRRRVKRRRAWARVMQESMLGTRTLLRGWLGTTVLGVFSIFPMAARLLNPRRYARMMKWLNESLLPQPRTELAFMRQGSAGQEAAQGLVAGFTTEEKVARVEAVLVPAGLRQGMARLVVVLGHGSTSLNNPHESAYNCGACGGRRGGPNARIFAAMANLPEVRIGLRHRGVFIPDDTWFLGGYHDTCTEEIEFFDLDRIPASHQGDLDRLRRSLDQACARSAHERVRRFAGGTRIRRERDALHHVQERAEHLAEPRPEYGHSTNAVCIVGRRATTRGLFLDRRAFLVSYDATQDPDNESLARLLAAVIPVCAGINLEYYFSRVDNERYGCGTKLPHNIVSLTGVMNGFEGDLRTGLTWQMVEIHEPVRILFVLETTPERALRTMETNPQLNELLRNRWIRLAVIDPVENSRVSAYRGDGRWECIDGGDEVLAEAPNSRAWYEGRSDHLPLARIVPGQRVAPAMAPPQEVGA